ncbi:hypothetical protein [Luteimonas sp. A649]
MTRPARRALLRTIFSTLIVLDGIGLAALVLNQWLVEEAGRSWSIAVVLFVPLFLLARPLSDALLSMADRYAGIPNAGEQIPLSGQSRNV